MSKKLGHEGTGLNEDELIVVLGNNWSFFFAWKVIKKYEFFSNPNWLASRVWEVKLNVDCKLAPAGFLNLEGWLAHSDVRLRKRLV